MNESRKESSEEQRPRWVPYTPPPADGWDRLGLFVRRYSFPVVLLLCVGGLGAALYWTALTSGSGGVPPRAERASVPSTVEEEPPPARSERVPLTVYSTPEGAAVRVNGDSIGTTPLVDRPVDTGVYLLSVEAPNHFRTDTVVVFRDSIAVPLRFALRPRPGGEGAAAPPSEPPPSADAAARPVPATAVPALARAAPSPLPVEGALYVTSVPLGAVVAVDGRERGRTPVSVSPLAVGEKTVRVTLDDHVPWSRTVAVQGDSVGRVHAELEPRTGRLRVLARPWGTIYIDGTLHARESDVWYETSLPAGEHRVTVVHPALGQRDQQVKVPADGEVSVVLDLQAESDPGTES